MTARVLIVDDEEGVLRALKRALRPRGWQLDTYSDPEAALAVVGEKDYQVAIADYRMPRMDGVTFLKELRAVQPDCQRLVLSGQADLQAVLAAVNEAGISRFVTKPWNDEELATHIQSLLEYQRVLMENRRLAAQVRRQQIQIDTQRSALERLESLSPGITQVEFDAEGAIVLNEDDY